MKPNGAIERVRAVAKKLKSLEGGSDQAPDETAIRVLLDLGAPGEVLAFFHALAVRDGYFQSGYVRIQGATDTVESNHDETPGFRISPYGYVVVAQSQYGEAYAVAPKDSDQAGAVLRFDPADDYDVVDRQSIAEKGEVVAKSFVEFLGKFMNGTVPADAPKKGRIKRDTPTWYYL